MLTVNFVKDREVIFGPMTSPRVLCWVHNVICAVCWSGIRLIWQNDCSFRLPLTCF